MIFDVFNKIKDNLLALLAPVVGFNVLDGPTKSDSTACHVRNLGNTLVLTTNSDPSGL